MCNCNDNNSKSNTNYNFNSGFNYSQSNPNYIPAIPRIDKPRSFYTQGIHGVEEYDFLASLDIYPFNLLSNEAKNDFREGLYFTHDLERNILIGWKRGIAYKELTKVQYVNLIQLVAGVNPTGPSYGAYIGNPKLPSLACAQNFTPCYRDPGPGCICKIFYNQECCFLRIRIISDWK